MHKNTHSVADFIKQGLFLTNLERYITQFLTLIKPWNVKTLKITDETHMKNYPSLEL